MTRDDWFGVLEQAADCGVRGIQLIGGEPTLHPDFVTLADRALSLGLEVEVFSNLVHVTPACWALFQRPGIRLATSYYSDQAAEHDAVTSRPTHQRTRANIAAAVRLGIPLRVGIITTEDTPHTAAARRDLQALGVSQIGVDHVRPFGRATHGHTPEAAGLCGHCGAGRAAINPAGDVTPCVLSDWMPIGNVKSTPLAAVLTSPALNEARTAIAKATRTRPDPDDPCEPDACNPYLRCAPDNLIPCTPDDAECAPGTPPMCWPRV